MDMDVTIGNVCDAEENDWLDVSYTERNYIHPKKAAKSRRLGKKISFKLTKPLKIAAVAVACVALLCGALLIDGDFGKGVFNTAIEAYSSTLPVFGGNKANNIMQISIPTNANLLNVEQGVATFDGGRATLSFTKGKVTDVTPNSVTVEMDEEHSITYSGLTNVFVAVGDTVDVSTLLGKYQGTFTAAVCANGQPVVDVVGSEQQLTWNV